MREGRKRKPKSMLFSCYCPNKIRIERNKTNMVVPDGEWRHMEFLIGCYGWPGSRWICVERNGGLR